MIRSDKPLARRARLTAFSVAVLAGAALPAAGLLASPASAAPPVPPPGNPTCIDTNATTVSCTFRYNGSAISWTVPVGVTSITATATGANGGSGNSGDASPGGTGGVFEGTLTGSALSGTTLSVFPGGQGGNGSNGSGGGGGANGGGNGGTGKSSANGGGGGGASTISVGDDLLLAAGGGAGGGGANNGGGGAGGNSNSLPGSSNGANGAGTNHGTGGQTYPSVAGGTAGANGTCTAGSTAGSEGSGGKGAGGTATGCAGGGGGGGGYYGGGGGGSGAGGGGGSSFPAANTTPIDGITVTPGDPPQPERGNGSVVLTFDKVRTELTDVIATKMPGNSLLASGVLTTSSGDALEGYTVTFTASGKPICTATTNSDGFATCLDPGASSILNSLSKIVTASYAGDTFYDSSTGLGAILRYV